MERIAGSKTGELGVNRHSGIRALGVLLSMAVVAYMSLKNRYPPAIQELFYNFGSVVLHALAYGGLTLIYFWAFLKGRHRGYLWAALFSISYGLALETAQLWVPGRTFSLGDITVNCLAAMLAGVVLKLL